MRPCPSRTPASWTGSWAWAVKKLLRLLRGFHGMDLSHPRIAQLDLAYHDTSATHQGCSTCSSAGVRWGPRKPRRSRAVEQAPETRARLRGRFVAAAHAADVEPHGGAGCASELNSRTWPRASTCKDPFATTQPDVEEMIRDLGPGQS
ncbi:proteasome accessory factor PafA2 family protein [Kocuria rhizophila]|nr:proteasome accessory factor PafA2 family protein [Kocuria rhizophila]